MVAIRVTWPILDFVSINIYILNIKYIIQLALSKPNSSWKTKHILGLLLAKTGAAAEAAAADLVSFTMFNMLNMFNTNCPQPVI